MVVVFNDWRDPETTTETELTLDYTAKVLDDDDDTDEEDTAEDLPGKAKQQKATLPEGERVCWRQFADTGCTSAGCGFVHVGPLGMGWMPSPMQLSQLRRQVRGLRGQTRWDWGKIDGFEFPRDVFA